MFVAHISCCIPGFTYLGNALADIRKTKIWVEESMVVNSGRIEVFENIGQNFVNSSIHRIGERKHSL